MIMHLVYLQNLMESILEVLIFHYNIMQILFFFFLIASSITGVALSNSSLYTQMQVASYLNLSTICSNRGMNAS